MMFVNFRIFFYFESASTMYIQHQHRIYVLEILKMQTRRKFVILPIHFVLYMSTYTIK